MDSLEAREIRVRRPLDLSPPDGHVIKYLESKRGLTDLQHVVPRNGGHGQEDAPALHHLPHPPQLPPCVEDDHIRRAVGGLRSAAVGRRGGEGGGGGQGRGGGRGGHVMARVFEVIGHGQRTPTRQRGVQPEHLCMFERVPRGVVSGMRRDGPCTISSEVIMST